MTAAAPAATVLPSMTLQPNVVAPDTPRSTSRSTKSPSPRRAVDKILSDEAGGRRKTAGREDRCRRAATCRRERRDAAVAVARCPRPSRHPPSHHARQPARGAERLAAGRVAAVGRRAASRIADAGRWCRRAHGADTCRRSAARRAHAAAGARAACPVSPCPTPRHEEHNFRVLAVDDSPLMRTFLQNKLQPYGIQPEFAASGEEALFKISKQHFDMIFLDVMLPGMDGYDVCKMIKKNKDNALMKVVMLTSKDKTFDKIRGTMAGCDGYLTKPVDEMKLRAIIERHTVAQK